MENMNRIFFRNSVRTLLAITNGVISSQLARKMQMNWSSTIKHIRVFEKSGLLIIIPIPLDKRGKGLYLTKKGEKIVFYLHKIRELLS
jgi:DNA-binding MarR family transcriptional regulator